MKKMMFLLVAALFSTATFAQETSSETIPVKKNRYVTNRFWDNWFVDFGGEWMTNYSSQEKGLGYNKNPFARFRGNGAFDVSLGKWATPNFGMRAKVIAAWGRQVNTDDNDLNPLHNGVSFSFEPLLNLNNLFCGYKPRLWNAILYGTVGYYRDITDEVNSPVVGAGLVNQFNITKRFHINIDLYGRFGDANMDGIAVPGGDNAKVLWDTRDWQIGWSLGCGFNLGKVGWDNAPDVDAIMVQNKAQLDALNASLADQQAENDRLKSEIANHKCKATATEGTSTFGTTPVSVFFNLNKTTIASRKDLVDVQEVAKYAKENGKTIVVSGYADSRTGSASWNQQLSEGRANAVVDELVNMGVSRDQIEVKSCGGVNDIAPFTYNRRVIVAVK